MGWSTCPNTESFFLPTQEISGWYYLLGEDLGRTKHLKVAVRRLKKNRGASLSRAAWEGWHGVGGVLNSCLSLLWCGAATSPMEFVSSR